MAKYLDPKQPVSLVPMGEEAKPEQERRTYLLRVPGLSDRAALQRAVRLAGGRQHPPLAMLAALRRGMEEIYGDPRDESEAAAKSNLLALIDADEEALRVVWETAKDQSEDGRAAFVEALAALSRAEAELLPLSNMIEQAYRPYAEMRADNEAYNGIYSIEAARLLLDGWENGPAEFRRGRTGVPDDLLARIPEMHLLQIGAKVQEMLRVSDTEAKNSVSPSVT
ncbi:hypothetical protein [Telmatospirillum sp. J64-1]|uniref:hypothetical protein n=1 Tax=Telmatospirillum sp. J64-1 TaxID=2502183 RepID=UPI00115F5395|nr:hypothetical protein [Telmatospirillum sp. J64-1]